MVPLSVVLAVNQVRLVRVAQLANNYCEKLVMKYICLAKLEPSILNHIAFYPLGNDRYDSDLAAY